MPDGVIDARAGLRGGQVRIVRHREPHLVLQRADHELPDRERSPMEKKGRTRRSRVDALDAEVSTVPSGSARIEP